MILVLTVFASTDENRDDKTFGPALAIGLSVTVCHLIGVSWSHFLITCPVDIFRKENPVCQ